MSPKPVVPRGRARRDVDEAIEHYLSEAGARAAHGFIESLQSAYERIGRHPASGSPRYARELGLPGLRFMALNRYPHLVFYMEQGTHVDVWRVLHGQRDIPEWMREPE